MHFSKMHFSKILQIFGGLVLGCIKTKFCKKICVRQHFSSSTRFASFCTAAISKFWRRDQFSRLTRTKTINNDEIVISPIRKTPRPSVPLSWFLIWAPWKASKPIMSHSTNRFRIILPKSFTQKWKIRLTNIFQHVAEKCCLSRKSVAQSQKSGLIQPKTILGQILKTRLFTHRHRR